MQKRFDKSFNWPVMSQILNSIFMFFLFCVLACEYNVHKGACFEAIEECPGTKKKRVSRIHGDLILLTHCGISQLEIELELFQIHNTITC